MPGSRPIVGLMCGLLGALAVLGRSRAAFAEPIPALDNEQAEAPSDVAVTPAERDFRAGQSLFLMKRYRDALGYFRRSFFARPSPNSRLYIARCLAELGELLAAHEEYKEVIVQVSEELQPDDYVETQQAATRERSRLRTRLSWVRVNVSQQVSGISVQLGGRRLSPEELERYVYLLPGAVELQATAPGYEPFRQRLYLGAGEAAQVAIVWPQSVREKLPKPAPTVQVTRMNRLRSMAVVSAGVGLAGLGTWAAFGLRAAARLEDVRELCRSGECSRSAITQGRTEATVSQVGLGVGLVGLLGGAALWVAGNGREADVPIALEWSIGPRSVGLSGRF